MREKVSLILLNLFLFWGGNSAMALTLTSSAFQNEGDIPAEYTCDGKDLFPGLQWSDIPDGTQTFVLICSDPDVPEELRSKVPDLVWDHLIMFNIQDSTRSISQGDFRCPAGAVCGKNSWGQQSYGGPCPPDPKYHRYFFTLYALDTTLKLDASAEKSDIIKAIDGHILGKATLMGRYIRQQ
jgi:hypothetical protein